MCGRLNVIDSPLVEQVCEFLGIDFSTTTNIDLSPTQWVASIVMRDDKIQQLNTTWGIKPEWSKKLLINAQAETVALKKTFKQAFAERRCIVPCSGWYEWRDEGGKRKQKYLFEHANNEPFYMAGIYYLDTNAQLVSLTIEPNDQCKTIYSRMPLLIEPHQVEQWFRGDTQQLPPLLSAVGSDLIRIKKCS